MIFELAVIRKKSQATIRSLNRKVTIPSVTLRTADHTFLLWALVKSVPLDHVA